jgi:hypothetical protein
MGARHPVPSSCFEFGIGGVSTKARITVLVSAVTACPVSDAGEFHIGFPRRLVFGVGLPESVGCWLAGARWPD